LPTTLQVSNSLQENDIATLTHLDDSSQEEKMLMKVWLKILDYQRYSAPMGNITRLLQAKQHHGVVMNLLMPLMYYDTLHFIEQQANHLVWHILEKPRWLKMGMILQK